MKRTILVLAIAAIAVSVTAVGGAQTPGETPFPSSKVVQYFLSTSTVTSTGELSNYFPQGSTVVFRAFAGQSKTGAILTGDQVKYFYVKIPGQPNVKLTYSASAGKKGLPAPWPWTATWTIPASYPAGIVAFKVLLRTKTGQYGSFVQIPVTSSQLTVTKA